jgi:hypothetical protein
VSKPSAIFEMMYEALISELRIKNPKRALVSVKAKNTSSRYIGFLPAGMTEEELKQRSKEVFILLQVYVQLDDIAGEDKDTPLRIWFLDDREIQSKYGVCATYDEDEVDECVSDISTYLKDCITPVPALH